MDTDLGFGAMLVIILFDIHQISYPIHVLFLSSGVVACLLEYLTSFVMEKLFHRRWWVIVKRHLI